MGPWCVVCVDWACNRNAYTKLQEPQASDPAEPEGVNPTVVVIESTRWTGGPPKSERASRRAAGRCLGLWRSSL